MTSDVRQTGITMTGRVALATVVILLGMSRSGQASAGFDAEGHGRHCSCGTTCKKASCCCGPRPSAKVPVPESAPTPAPAVNLGPRCGAAPCGEGGLPSSPNVRPLDQAAMTAALDALLPAILNGAHFDPPSCRRPARLTSRLDDPPERAACSA